MIANGGRRLSCARRLLDLHADRDWYLDTLDRLPLCLCHGDADRRNLSLQRRSDRVEMIAVDWAFSGLSAMGDDVQNLVNGSFVWQQIPAESLEQVEGAAYGRYVDGLTEAGWRGDPRQVRLGYACSSALKWGLVLACRIMSMFCDENYTGEGSRFGTLQQQVAMAGRLLAQTLGHAIEARELAVEIGLS